MADIIAAPPKGAGGKQNLDKLPQDMPAGKTEAKEAGIPRDLQKALQADPLVHSKWKDLTPIARRDFIAWIDSAKQTETRARRIDKACDMLLAGKRRPCCFAVVPLDLHKALGAAPLAKAAWSKLSSDDRRDLISWIDEAKERDGRKDKICEAIASLQAGKIIT